jgi:hypothetical protein
LLNKNLLLEFQQGGCGQLHLIDRAIIRSSGAEIQPKGKKGIRGREGRNRLPLVIVRPTIGETAGGLPGSQPERYIKLSARTGKTKNQL